jgi:hypothetical protein
MPLGMNWLTSLSSGVGGGASLGSSPASQAGFSTAWLSVYSAGSPVASVVSPDLPKSPGVSIGYPTVLYATDEDIALRASADYRLLCPKDQQIAIGKDGVFLSSDRWTLTSATVDFQARGAAPYQLVQIEKPGTGPLPICESYVVSGVAPGAATLRRKGLPTGVGEPPSPAAGLTGIAFGITTFLPQIALATLDINRRFGISNGLYGGRCVSELADPHELREAVVLTVLFRQYLEMSRELAAPSDTFAEKAKLMKAELVELLDRLALHWSRTVDGAGLASPSTRFSTRMSR